MITINNGLRDHGGVGDQLVKKSFYRKNNEYFGRFFFDILYFILLIIVLLNIIFGIIINTFRELRIKSQKKIFDLYNICFICGVEKDTIEKNSENFEIHTNEKHNLWNYTYYIIGLMFCNIQDLNSINSYAMEKIANKDISWIPEYKKKEE